MNQANTEPLEQRDKAHLIIHSCATGAGCWSGLTATLPIAGPVTADTVGLGTITMTMGSLLSRHVFHRKWKEGGLHATAVASLQFVFGATLIKMVVSVVPVVSTFVNAAISFATVEAVGWGLYKILEEGKEPSEMSREEIVKYMRDAEAMREQYKREFAWTEQLSPENKKRYEELSKQLRVGNLSSEQQDEILKKIIELRNSSK